MGIKIVKETIYLRINSLNQQLTQEAVIQEAVILRFYLFKTRLCKVRLIQGTTYTRYDFYKGSNGALVFDRGS
jgi:hypothetical protein